MTTVLVIDSDLSIHLFHFNSDLHYLSPEDDGPEAKQQEGHWDDIDDEMNNCMCI